MELNLKANSASDASLFVPLYVPSRLSLSYFNKALARNFSGVAWGLRVEIRILAPT